MKNFYEIGMDSKKFVIKHAMKHPIKTTGCVYLAMKAATYRYELDRAKENGNIEESCKCFLKLDRVLQKISKKYGTGEKLYLNDKYELVTYDDVIKK